MTYSEEDINFAALQGGFTALLQLSGYFATLARDEENDDSASVILEFARTTLGVAEEYEKHIREEYPERLEALEAIGATPTPP